MKKLFAGFSGTFALLGLAQIAGAYVDISSPNKEIERAGIAAFILQAERIINYIVPFLVGLAVLVLIYGVFTFIHKADDEEARASAKQFIIWGVIGVFIMISVWGLVTILDNTFVLQKTGDDITAPVFTPDPWLY